MDLVVELKINNPDDWTLIERLLKRLEIDFSQIAPSVKRHFSLIVSKKWRIY